MTVQDVGRLLVTAALVAMFGYALYTEHDPQTRNLLIGALVGAFSTGAIQFWFGTSPQSAGKDQTIARQTELIDKALRATPPSIDKEEP